MRIEPHEKLRLLTAAYHAKKKYPGPVGELIAREIESWADFGYRFDNSALVPRVVKEVMNVQPAAISENPGVGGSPAA